MQLGIAGALKAVLQVESAEQAESAIKRSFEVFLDLKALHEYSTPLNVLNEYLQSRVSYVSDYIAHLRSTKRRSYT